MRKLIILIVTAWHRFTLRQDLKIAIKTAKELRYKNHKKYMVIYLQIEFKVFERQQLKEMIRKGGTFKRGVNIRQLERMAYFITD